MSQNLDIRGLSTKKLLTQTYWERLEILLHVFLFRYHHSSMGYGFCGFCTSMSVETMWNEGLWIIHCLLKIKFAGKESWKFYQEECL